MKIQNQIINGFFEYSPNLIFTQGDIILYVDPNQSRLFRVKSEVKGVNPLVDINETYYEDYFLKVYGSTNVLTKSNVQTYLNSFISGLSTNSDGELDLISIAETDLTKINKTCVFTTGGKKGFAIINRYYSFMLVTSTDSAYYRVGSKAGYYYSWGPIQNIGTNLDNIISSELANIEEMKTLLANKIQEFNDKINGIN